jgi:hypothetical protein
MSDRKNKRTRITLSELINLEVILPKGFENTERVLTVVFQNGKPTVGLMKSIPILEPIDDLNRLYSAQRIVAGQEAHEKRATESGVLMNAFIRLVDKPAEANPAPNFKAEAVRIRSLVNTMDRITTSIKDNISRDGESTRLKPILLENVKRISDSFQDYLAGLGNNRLRGKTLDDFLLEKGVLKNLFSKLTTGSPIQLNTSLARFLYPAKIENFLKASLKEMHHEKTRESLHFLSPKAVNVVAVLTSNENLRKLVPREVPLDQLDNPKTKIVMNHGLPLIPSLPWADWYTESKSVPYKRRVQNILEGIEELAASQVNRFNGILAPLADNGSFWQTMLGLGHPVQPLEIGGYKAAVIKVIEHNHIEFSKTFETSFLDRKRAEEQLPLFFHKLQKDAVFFLTAEVEKLASEFVKQKATIVVVDNPLPILKIFSENTETTELLILSQMEKAGVNKAFLPAKKKDRRSIPLSGLTERSKDLIRILPKDYRSLADEIAKYLRSFSNDAFQNAAVKLINAAIDANEYLYDSELKTEERFAWADDESNQEEV